MHEVNANDVVIDAFDNFLPLMVVGSSKTPKEFILDLLAATHPVPLCNSLGVLP
jgi:hypothetical protein